MRMLTANGEKMSKNKKKQLRKKAKKNQERIEKDMARLQRMDHEHSEPEEDPMSPSVEERLGEAAIHPANGSKFISKTSNDHDQDLNRKELQFMVMQEASGWAEGKEPGWWEHQPGDKEKPSPLVDCPKIGPMDTSPPPPPKSPKPGSKSPSLLRPDGDRKLERSETVLLSPSRLSAQNSVAGGGGEGGSQHRMSQEASSQVELRRVASMPETQAAIARGGPSAHGRGASNRRSLPPTQPDPVRNFCPSLQVKIAGQ